MQRLERMRFEYVLSETAEEGVFSQSSSLQNLDTLYRRIREGKRTSVSRMAAAATRDGSLNIENSEE